MQQRLSHGQNSIVVSREDLDRCVDLVNSLMQIVSERIINGYELETYLDNQVL
jgi:hypothetical protein